MEVIKLMSDVVSACIANADLILGAIISLLVALTGLFLAIPGDAPEKQLKAAVEFLSKFSRKPKSE
jgi:hypothetical protein